MCFCGQRFGFVTGEIWYYIALVPASGIFKSSKPMALSVISCAANFFLPEFNTWNDNFWVALYISAWEVYGFHGIFSVLVLSKLLLLPSRAVGYDLRDSKVLTCLLRDKYSQIPEKTCKQSDVHSLMLILNLTKVVC